MRLRQHLRYRFDNYMARGVGGQILLLALFTSIIVLITSVLIVVCDVVPTDKDKDDSFGMLIWKSLMHALDPGTLAGDTGSWTFLFILLFVTIGGLFVLSALIGILNQGFGAMIESWRRGRSVVMETGHTVVLGWGPKVHTLLHELAIANDNQRDACVVILSDTDKVEMDAEVAATIRGTKLRVVTRRGSVMSTDDLALVGLETSKAVVVVAPEYQANGALMAPHESDTVVMKALLAIGKAVDQISAPPSGGAARSGKAGPIEPKAPIHIVAEILDERTEAVARMVVGERAALVLAGPLISRLLVQTGRQSGLSSVYTELLDFAGMEMYLALQPELAGKTFRDAIFLYDSSALLGVRTASGETLLPPPLDRKFDAKDRIIAISEDDDTIVRDGKSTAIDQAAIVAVAPEHVHKPERSLVLGTSARLMAVLAELDSYVVPGSELVVVGDKTVAPVLANMTVTSKVGDVTNRGLLDSLDVTAFDHVLVLSETEGRTQEIADARTTVALLHLRDISRKAGKRVPITSEILDIQNRDLASVAEADDFIVSNTLVSLMVSQLAENPELVAVFDALFSSGGYEIYLKPATDYVVAGTHAFATVCEAALRREEIALGYKLASKSRDAAAAFGVAINPLKSAKVKLGAADKVIVLAED